MAQKVRNKYPEEYCNGDTRVKEYFLILNTCYQVGVFFSRSSLRFIKIKKVWILSFLQFINWSFMFYNSYYLKVETLYAMCPLLVWVGLMGGGSYVNVLHGILELKTLKKSEKEMAMSLSLLFNDTGILLATTLSLILGNTLLKVKDTTNCPDKQLFSYT